jgi:hypothetical protein
LVDFSLVLSQSRSRLEDKTTFFQVMFHSD